MAAVTSKDVSIRLSKQLANFRLSDAVINGLADRVMIEGLSIIRFNPCIYGVCFEYHTEKMPRLDALQPKSGIYKFEVFPLGLIDWDRYLVRVAFNVDELEGKGLTRGLHD
jgi:hypothetical protein